MKQATLVEAVERLDSKIHAFTFIDREADSISPAAHQLHLAKWCTFVVQGDVHQGI